MRGENTRSSAADQGREPPNAPLLPGAWTKLSSIDASAVLAMADVSWPAGWTAGPLTRVYPLRALHALPLHFLPHCVLLQFDLRLRAGLRGTLDAVWGPGWLQWLTGSVRWLPGQADAVPGLSLRLENAVQVADYLRFFCGCLRLDQGHRTFRVVDSADDAALHGATPGPWRRQMRRCRVVPAPEGGHRVHCILLHAGNLQRAVYHVGPDGRVQLRQSESLAEGVLPPETMRPPLRSVVSLPDGPE